RCHHRPGWRLGDHNPHRRGASGGRQRSQRGRFGQWWHRIRSPESAAIPGGQHRQGRQWRLDHHHDHQWPACRDRPGASGRQRLWWRGSVELRPFRRRDHQLHAERRQFQRGDRPEWRSA
ncbi:hypothetical protein LTR94_035071, partial [Friedmanniomyces endolithicus]